MCVLCHISATVQFNPTEYTVEEGESTTLMLTLSAASSEAVTVELVSTDNTARSKIQYTVCWYPFVVFSCVLSTVV